jgi:hypothetical protein
MGLGSSRDWEPEFAGRLGHYWGCRVPRNLSMQWRLLIQIYTEGLSRFVTSMTAPVASGWSGWSGGLAPTWKAPPCHGAHVKRSFLIATVAVIVGGIGRSQEDVGLIEVSGLVRNAGPWLSDRWSQSQDNRHLLALCVVALPPSGIVSEAIVRINSKSARYQFVGSDTIGLGPTLCRLNTRTTRAPRPEPWR